MASLWLPDTLKGAPRPSAIVQVEPRLLGLEDAGRYLGVSGWTIRDYMAAGILAPVELPTPSGRGRLKRLLFDRRDLDQLADAGRGPA